MKDDKVDKESDFYKNAVDICEHIVNKVLDVELSRGDWPTIFFLLPLEVSNILRNRTHGSGYWWQWVMKSWIEEPIIGVLLRILKVLF